MVDRNGVIKIQRSITILKCIIIVIAEKKHSASGGCSTMHIYCNTATVQAHALVVQSLKASSIWTAHGHNLGLSRLLPQQRWCKEEMPFQQYDSYGHFSL